MIFSLINVYCFLIKFMESNLSEFEEEPVSRPTLLNVLCILTFIGSTWTILTNIWAYSTADKTAKIFSNIRHNNIPDSISKSDSVIYKVGDKKRSMFGEKMMSSLSNLFTAEKIKENALGVIITAIFTLSGALLMWRMRRIGFYLYSTGVLLSIIVPFYLFGNNLLAIGISSFSNFFGLVFVALYALNFKVLKK